MRMLFAVIALLPVLDRRAEIYAQYAGRVECCPLVSHAEYAPHALLSLEKDGTDRRTDGLQTVTLRLSLDAATGQHIN